MNFKGLFIGIDRYTSPSIHWLNCAKNDALGLHCLFLDTIGGDSKILTDQDATREAILNEFSALTSCDENDFVVVAFSGHGSNTHELICHDSDPYNLTETSISLQNLFECFKSIPAKRLLFIIDCCFSGGIGTKTFQTEVASRNFGSEEPLINQLSGEGRIIFTASSPLEPAWENRKYGHGFLTYYLIEGLQGTNETIEAGKIDVYALLKSVTSKVSMAANAIGKKQNPTIRGSIDGTLQFPIFITGEYFRKNFPQNIQVPISENLESLQNAGIPLSIIDIWKNSIPTLNELQISAINDYKILMGHHLVVSAPTSSGKTFVAELATILGVVKRKRTIFLFPLKALVNDKHQEFNRKYNSIGIKIIRATGDSNDDVPLLTRGQYDICLMTYEKFTSILLGCPHVLEQIDTLVIDEVQMIADPSRGVNLEFILTIIRLKRKSGIEPQLITLSAVIGDTNGFEKWLQTGLLRRNSRPIPLQESIILPNGDLRSIHSETQTETIERRFINPIYSKGSSQDYIIPLVKKLVSEGKQVIVFRAVRGEAKGAASYLAKNLDLPPAQDALDKLPKGDSSFASQKLHECLNGGVAFHISDLDREERLIIEECFRAKNSTIRVLTATTTLAMGVNTPAEAVIIAGLEHPGKPPKAYTIAEYKNIIGRAGRLGFANTGSSYLLAISAFQDENYWRKYVKGKPEDINSKFLENSTDPRSLILRILVTAKTAKNSILGLTAENIINFLEFSFGSFQKTQLYPTWKWDLDGLIKALVNLQSHKLIIADNEGKYRLTELGWLTGERGIEVESITRLVEILSPLAINDITDPLLITATQLTLELDQIYIPINPRGAQKELESWRSELKNQAISTSILGKLGQSSDPKIAASRYKKAVACLLWITDLPLPDMEKILARHGGGFDGTSGPIRSTALRTHDLLITTARVAEILHPGLKLEDRIYRLFVRLEVGVPPKLVDLAKHIGLAFSRSDYQNFLKANLCDMAEISSFDEKQLLNILNGDQQKLILLKNACETFSNQELLKNENVFSPSLPMYES